MDSRSELRQQMRLQRRALTHSQQLNAAMSLTQHVARSSLFQNSQHIAFYLPNEGEMDLSGLISLAWQYNKQCYLPVLGLRNSRKMWFIPYEPGHELVANRFGILEPQHDHRDRLFKAQRLDLIFMPLVAFDNNGNRLGMGGGFYDRTLQFLNHRHNWLKPRLIGTAHAFQQVEQLQNENWDVPMHGVATENGLVRF